jgi:hypothetical protein
MMVEEDDDVVEIILHASTAVSPREHPCAPQKQIEES